MGICIYSMPNSKIQRMMSIIRVLVLMFVRKRTFLGRFWWPMCFVFYDDSYYTTCWCYDAQIYVFNLKLDSLVNDTWCVLSSWIFLTLCQFASVKSIHKLTKKKKSCPVPVLFGTWIQVVCDNITPSWNGTDDFTVSLLK